jgi:pimeloyl-ACP methyl ester carboxylesterase
MEVEGKLIEFHTSDGFLLHGFLQMPRGAKTCVVYLHGMNGNFYRGRRVWEMAQKLNKNGVGFFTINTRGHDSLAKINARSSRKWGIMGGTHVEEFKDCIYDISGAINALRKLRFERFILAGHSTGCQKVIYYQYKRADRSVIGLLLLAPADDYNGQKRDLGKKFAEAVRVSKALVRKRRGSETDNRIPDGFSAKRFLSVGDPRSAEARIFNYDGRLSEFSKIKEPICAVFGSREEHAVKPVKTYMKILGEKTHSKMFVPVIIKGAKHSFENHNAALAKVACDFASKVTKTTRSSISFKLT